MPPPDFGENKNNAMLNENLFDDPKDAEIARLKLCISRFKEYDQKRKQFYADKLQRLGELESYVQELESGTVVETLKKRNTDLHNQVRLLSKIIQARKLEESRTEEELSEAIANCELKKRNRKLTEQVRQLMKERKKWIAKQLEECRQ